VKIPYLSPAGGAGNPVEQGPGDPFHRTFIPAMIKPESIEDESLSESQKSPLARLVFFMVCSAIAGSILAGAHYYTIDLPQQTAVVAPANSPSDNCQECYDWCAR